MAYGHHNSALRDLYFTPPHFFCEPPIHIATPHQLLPITIALVVLALGGCDARQAAPLELPWSCGERYALSQGNAVGSHAGKGQYAWDFRMPVGATVRAMRGGRVRLVRGDSTRGGCRERFARDANFVVIAHDDGTEALYLHLAAGSLRVRAGQQVAAGAAIGEVGLTGWVCGAHLHVQVQRPCASWWCQSIPSTFTTTREGALPYNRPLSPARCAR